MERATRPQIKARYGSHSQAFDCPLCGREHQAFLCSLIDIQPALANLDEIEAQLRLLPAETKEQARVLLENARAAIRALYVLSVGP